MRDKWSFMALVTADGDHKDLRSRSVGVLIVIGVGLLSALALVAMKLFGASAMFLSALGDVGNQVPGSGLFGSFFSGAAGGAAGPGWAGGSEGGAPGWGGGRNEDTDARRYLLRHRYDRFPPAARKVFEQWDAERRREILEYGRPRPQPDRGPSWHHYEASSGVGKA